MYRELFSRPATSRIRRGRAALGVLMGVALLSAFAGGALYFLVQQPQVPNIATPEDSDPDSPNKDVKDAVEPADTDSESQTMADANSENEDSPQNASAAEISEAEMQAAPEIDPEQQKQLEQIAAIKSGNWTTRRIVALTAVGPYVIDFRTSIDGQSLEETERENLDAIADQLLSPPVAKTEPPMMAQGEATSETSSDETSDNPQSAEMQPSTSPGTMSEDSDQQNIENEEAEPPEGEKVAGETLSEEELEISWSELLDRPLVAAGWLGNLIAEDEERDQLISMYDRERDDMVSRDELRDFLSRGLSRRHSVQLADIGNSPDARDTSPWGPFDLNKDYVLDKSEASKIADRFKDIDADGDKAITLAEARPTSMQSMAQSPMILTAKTLYIVEPIDSDTTETEQLRQFGNLAARVIEHYTFLSELPREKWPGYPQARWQAIDKDESDGIDRYEMRRLFQLPADINVFLRFAEEHESGFIVHADLNPEQTSAESQPEEHATAPVEDDRGFTWVAAKTGGHLAMDGLSLKINIEDQFSSTSREYVVGQIQSALKNAQLATALRTSFQLGDEALEIVDSDGDGEVSEAESDRLWQWLTARQSTRLAGRWMLAPEPWFQLLDRSADGSVSETEAAWLAEGFDEMYGGGEAVLGAGDPLLAQFTVRRADPRLENNAPMESPDSGDQPAAPLDWFAAMDLNGDGSIDESEFLGDIPDFSDLDVNKDGYLRRSELYVP